MVSSYSSNDRRAYEGSLLRDLSIIHNVVMCGARSTGEPASAMGVGVYP